MHTSDTALFPDPTQRSAATRSAIDAGSNAIVQTVTTFHEEARQLRAIWDANPESRPAQAQFGELFEIGGQSAVANFLSGRSPLSLKAAIGFARGLKVRLQDFSPRLATEAISIAKALDQLHEHPPRAHSWPATACSLRAVVAQAHDWANQIHQLADWCDAQAATVQSTAAAPAAVATPASPVTLEALEAGLMALASGLGRDHAALVLQAIHGATHPAPIATSLAAEAALIGGALDHDSLEQGEPA